MKEKDIGRKSKSGWIFLGIIGAIYLLLGLIKLNLMKNSLFLFFNLVWKILPIIALVFGIMFIINLFLDPKKIAKYLGKEAGLKSWIIVILAGILSSGSIYLWYPLLKDLKEKGTRVSFIATFLYNRAVKIPLMPLMIYYFGWSFTLLLSIYMIIFSVINGIIVEKIMEV